jgi:predicted O-linked N-acetylglucosamine transferase (SPINDLY family)
LKRIETGENIGNTFPLLTALDHPLRLKKAAENHCLRFQGQKSLKPLRRARARNPQRVTIAYISSDLDTSHPVGANLKPLLEGHDRRRFKLLAVNLSENPKANLLRHFDQVQQGYSLPDSEIAEWARAKGVDIAVDLNGYTEGSRVGIFAERASPIQINYLGYPGTMGTSFHDFIVADAYIIPPEDEAGYTEKVLRLPHFFMPYDFTSREGLSTSWMDRKAFGLPDDAFVLCSFNDFHKISEKMLSSWRVILQKSRNTVLWLANRGDIHDEEIRNFFESGGIGPERLIIAKRVESHTQHLARLMLADLMLDTFPYNSHTTACDAVKSGLPVLTICGRTFQSRVCASLLNQIDAHYLITPSIDEYISRAVEIASNPALFASLRIACQKGRARIPSASHYARSMEELYISSLS